MPDTGTPLASKLNAFLRLSPAELGRLEQLQARRRRFEAGSELVHERQIGHNAFILQEGWAVSYKLLGDGGRQVVDFRIPGDFMGLRSLLLRTSDHSVAAVTDIVACEVTAAELAEAFEALPRLAAATLWAASRDEAIVIEHLVNVGRRGALARTAHHFLELGLRLRLVGLAGEDGFACPLNQYLLADALGLSAIHLNRTLRVLRERGAMTFQAGQVTIPDVEELEAIAAFDSGYLDHGDAGSRTDDSQPRPPSPPARKVGSPAQSRGRADRG